MVGYDLLGYLGLVILVLSFLATSRIKKLSTILLGVIAILVYAILKEFYPVVILFSGLVIFLIYQIIQSFSSKPTIDLVETDHDSSYVKEFISNYKKDIYSYFPFFTPRENQKYFLVMRDMNVAGIFIGNITGDVFTIEVDYTKPLYRDNLVGNYIFKQNLGFFKKYGINKLIAKSFHNRHNKYLSKMGFVKTYIDDQLFYVKNIE